MNRQTVRERLLASTMIGGAALMALSAAPAFAADEPATVKEVVVTGSRIPQPGLTSASPLSVINDQEVKLQGVTNAEDLVNNLPQVFASFGTMQSNGATGTATVNLRGLGTSRTLVLVNGSRLMPGDTSTVNGNAADLNQIPSSLIDRVEVVTGGASAVYGSDAIAGVVNFIMKRDFEGLRIDSQYKFYQDNNNNSFMQGLAKAGGFPTPTGTTTGGDTWSFTAVMGANAPDGKGNITAYAGYQHLKAVTQDKYDYSACALATSIANASQACVGSSTSFPGRFQFLDRSLAVPASKSFKPVTASGGFVPYSLAADAFNFAPYNYFQRPDERYTAGYFAHYQVKPWAEVYSSLMFMHDQSVAQIAPGGSFRSSGFPLAGATTPENPTFLVNCDNPLLTGNEKSKLCGFGGPNAVGPTDSVPVNIGRRNVEGGPRLADLRHISFRIVEGVKGDFGDVWHYDVYGQYGRVDQTNINDGYLSTTKLARAYQVVSDPRPGKGGAPVCKSVLDGTDPSCVPYNIWNTGGVTPAALNYLTVSGIQVSELTEQIVSGNLTGDLGKYGMKSPWAKDGVGVSLGAEYRRETLQTHPDLERQTGDQNGTGGTVFPVHGSFDVKEVFGEIRVPLVQDAPFAKDLAFEGGYRISDYSSSGHVNSYKAAVDWAIQDDVRLRGSFQRAVRAPNITELFVAPQFGLFGGQDPCAGAVVAARVTGCAASGAVVGPNQNNYGHIQPCSAGQCTGRFGGNPNLKPEESDTISYGVVFTPTFIKGFTATIDYFDVKVDKVISFIPGSLSVNQCVATSAPIYCSNVHRSATTGEISGDGFIDAVNKNLGSLRTKGIDTELNYRTSFADMGMGDLGGLAFNFVGTYTQHLIITPVPGGGSFDCAGLYGTSCLATPAAAPAPKWRHKLRATWVTPWNLTLSADWRHFGKADLDQNTSQALLAGAHDPIASDAHLPAMNWIDVSGTWRFRDGMMLRAGVNNVFDKHPPIVEGSNLGLSGPPFGNGNTFPQVYDALGRTIFIGITADF